MTGYFQCEFTVVRLLLFSAHLHVAVTVISQSVTKNATTIAGQPVLLYCIISQPANAVWLGPGDGLPVTVGPDVVAKHSSRMKIVGDLRKGEYNLLIQFARFPNDTGIWTCTCLTRADLVQKTTLTILVPPATEFPEVSPKSISSTNLDFSSSLYTFTCVAHYAFPLVELFWIKESGPDVKYTVSPPRVIVSRCQTMSVSRTLLVTSANAGSQFICKASHPTFRHPARQETVYFMLSSSELSAPKAAHLRQADILPVAEKSTVSTKNTGSRQLDSIDQAFILIAVAIVTGCFVIGILLSKCSTKWNFSVHLDQVKTTREEKSIKYDMVETVDRIRSTDDRTMSANSKQKQPQCLCRIFAFLILAFFLISSLLFSFPFYLKGITVPLIETDETLSVFAGSALWLDCTSLVQPVESLVQVTWHLGEELFYYQYYLNGQVIGYPPNTTNGFKYHVRASSQSVGQLTIWPVAPGEGGVYSCHIITSGYADEGQIVQRQKTITVFVLLGPPINYALLVCLSVAVVSAISSTILVLHYVVRCQLRKLQMSERDVKYNSTGMQ